MLILIKHFSRYIFFPLPYFGWFHIWSSSLTLSHWIWLSPMFSSCEIFLSTSWWGIYLDSIPPHDLRKYSSDLAPILAQIFHLCLKLHTLPYTSFTLQLSPFFNCSFLSTMFLFSFYTPPPPFFFCQRCPSLESLDAWYMSDCYSPLFLCGDQPHEPFSKNIKAMEFPSVFIFPCSCNLATSVIYIYKYLRALINLFILFLMLCYSIHPRWSQLGYTV